MAFHLNCLTKEWIVSQPDKLEERSYVRSIVKYIAKTLNVIKVNVIRQ